MSESTHQCKAVNDTSYFIPIEDEFDKEDERYVPGEGILIGRHARCRFVAQPDKDLCLKHQYMVDQKLEVEMAPVDDK
jgi:hypothetical protein